MCVCVCVCARARACVSVSLSVCMCMCMHVDSAVEWIVDQHCNRTEAHTDISYIVSYKIII